MKKILSILLAVTMFILIFTGCSNTVTNTNIKDGTYTNTVAAHNGNLTTVTVIKNGVIASVEITQHEESDGIADKALSDIPNDIVQHQSTAIDAIAGATVTSKAIINGVEEALVEAGADLATWQKKPTDIAVSKKDDISCDTVVIGAGGAGIKTAVELQAGGQNVILVEKMPFIGGATNLAATYFVAVDTDIQKEAGMGIAVEDYVDASLKKSPNLDRDKLISMFNASQENLDWLNSLGADITRPLSNYQVATSDGSSLGVTIVQVMSKLLDESNVDCRLNTTATQLIVENDSIIGVKVYDAGGEYNIFADNIVIATGGFASGSDAVAEFAPDWAGLPSTSAVGSTGDGAYMAREIGASLKYMDKVRLNPSVYSNESENVSLSAARAEGGIMVNLNGERFCNDYYSDYTQLSYWMLEQEGDYVYILIDQKSMDSSKRLQGFLEKGYFLQAETVEELASLMNVPTENLVKTIDTYSTFAKNGVDEEFGRASNMSTTFETAPYYAIKTQPGLQVTLGGIEVNDNMQIMKEDSSIFENLYAVGEVAHDGLFGSAPTTINIYFGNVVANHILNK